MTYIARYALRYVTLLLGCFAFWLLLGFAFGRWIVPLVKRLAGM